MMTKAQREGLAKLIAMQPFQTVQKNGGTFIETGLNTNLLHNMWRKGFISCSNMCLGGYVTPDLKILKTPDESV